MSLPESTEEKSLLLAKAMDWAIVPHPIYSDDMPLFVVPDEIDYEWEMGGDFYHPSLMELAWHVAKWAYEELRWLESDIPITENGRYPIWAFPIEIGQPALLDSILERAVYCGKFLP